MNSKFNILSLFSLLIFSNICFSQDHEIYVYNEGDSDIYVAFASEFYMSRYDSYEVNVERYYKVEPGSYSWDLESFAGGRRFISIAEKVDGNLIALGVWTNNGGFNSPNGFKIPVTGKYGDYRINLSEKLEFPNQKLNKSFVFVPFTIQVDNEANFGTNTSMKTHIYIDAKDGKKLGIVIPETDVIYKSPYYDENYEDEVKRQLDSIEKEKADLKAKTIAKIKKANSLPGVEYVNKEYVLSRKEQETYGNSLKCAKNFIYEVKVIDLKWTPRPNVEVNENTKGIYEIEIEFPIYKNISSKILKYKGRNPAHYSKEDVRKFIAKKYPYDKYPWLIYDVFICEDMLAEGKFEITFIRQLGK